MRILGALEEALVRVGKWYEAERIWGELKGIGGEYGWKYKQAELLKQLALVMIRASHWERATQLREMVERLTYEAIKDGETLGVDYWRDWEFWIGWELGRALGKNLTWEEAERVAGGNIWEKAKPFAELGKALGQEPNRITIEEVISKIPNRDMQC